MSNPDPSHQFDPRSIWISAKILHQHEVAAALIHLRKEERASVWREDQARVRWREGLVQRGNRRHFADREVEEFNDRSNGLIRRGKVDPFWGHSPKAPIARFVVVQHRRLGASRHRRLPDAGNRRRVITLPRMIQANSLQVAETFNLKDRGKLSPGYFAGAILFNEKTIADRATYDNPEVFAEGMKYVIVSGKMAMFSSKPRIAEERNNFAKTYPKYFEKIPKDWQRLFSRFLAHSGHFPRQL
jgi:hypothetical protein